MNTTEPIVCRFCTGTNCEHGDDCADCGCPKCGFPGARAVEEGRIRGFCGDCGWEAAPGAYNAWTTRQPVLTTYQMHQSLLALLGVDLPPDDAVGGPIFPSSEDSP